jgi:hypothetical protein
MPKDHFVAQTYLKHFADASGFLQVCRKSDSLVFPARPEAICHELAGDIIPDFLENPKHLGEYRKLFEPHWNDAVSELSARRWSPDIKLAISGYLANLMVCTPAMTRVFLEAADHNSVERLRAKDILQSRRGIVDEKLREGLAALDAGKIVLETERDYIRALMAKNLMTYAWSLFNADWSVIGNLTGVDFITSDNPVAFDDPGPFRGGEQRLPRYLAITPKFCLYVEMGSMPREDEVDFAKPPDGSVRFGTIDQDRAAERVNLAVIRCAEDLIVSTRSSQELHQLVAANAPLRVSNEFITITSPDSILQGQRLRVWDPAKNVQHIRFPPKAA